MHDQLAPARERAIPPPGCDQTNQAWSPAEPDAVGQPSPGKRGRSEGGESLHPDLLTGG
jgi:hypothetical protein